MSRLSDYKTQQKNTNKHNSRGLEMLEKSISGDGWIGAITVAADDETFAGSARLEKSSDVFGDVEPIVIETDGTQPVILKRTDIPNANDPKAKRLSIADNRIQEVDLTWDTNVLLTEFDDIDLDKWWSKNEFENIGFSEISFAGDDAVGASPWNRMGGESEPGVLFCFGEITCRIPLQIYDRFLIECPDKKDDIVTYVSKIFNI